MPDTATVTIADDPPLVTVVASDAQAAELGRDPGEFTFSRSGGDPGGSLAVSFMIEGTAVNGADYDFFFGSVNIPAGQGSVTLAVSFTLGGSATEGDDYAPVQRPLSFAAPRTSVTVAVTPTLDDADELDETVVFELVGGDAYRIGGSGSATVTIANTPPPSRNLPPRANGDTYVFDPCSLLGFFDRKEKDQFHVLGAPLTNDIDPEGDTLDIVAANATPIDDPPLELTLEGGDLRIGHQTFTDF